MAPTPDFAHVLEHLRDITQPFPPTDLYLFSDLGAADLAALEAVWPDVDVERRRAVMQDLGEIGEANLEVLFEAVFRLGLEDEDAEVRATAIHNLWESEAVDLVAPLIDLMLHDPVVEVRAAAASALGRFVFLGEVEQLPRPQARRIEETLLSVARGQDDREVRRRALEAIAFASRPEVPELIAQAYASPEVLNRVSAVFAMGRSADARWADQVLAELESVEQQIRYEATRAAGELELKEAVPALKKMMEESDVQVREAAIWSLGQVGGDDARAFLLDLLQDASDDEHDFIEDALENLTFQEDLMADFPLLSMDEDELAALDLEAEDEDEDDAGLFSTPDERLN